MTTSQSSSLELLSALADGELAGGELKAVESVFLSLELQSDWNTYQVIGHALRAGAGACALAGADSGFLQRLNLRLADEKPVSVVRSLSGHCVVVLPMQAAANASVFRWKLVAGFASVSAALVVAWSLVGAPNESLSSQLSQSSAADQVVVLSPQGPIVRDARLEELMAAHKQLGVSSLQAPSGFLRNAGFEDSQCGRR
jgi:sigma-E factor negative regulatory protein RseA